MFLRELLKSFTKKEWYFIIILSFVLMVVTEIQFIQPYFYMPKGYHFVGALSADTNTYYSRMEQVDQGYFLWINLYTSEDQPRIWFDPFWFSAGLMGKILNLSHPVTFNLLRIICIPFYVFIGYLFCSMFFSSRKQRAFTCFLIFFASGVGVFFSSFFRHNMGNYSKFVYNLPVDLWQPEAIPFYSIISTPHFIFSAALMILIFIFFLTDSLVKKGYRYIFLAGLTAVALFSFHPFKVPIVYLTLGIYTVVLIIKERKFWFYAKRLLIFLAISSVPLYYYYYLSNINQTFYWHNKFNLCLSPPIYQFLFGMGIPLIFMFVSIVYLAVYNKLFTEKYLFILSWVVAVSLLLYSPFAYQRRFIDNLFVGIVILASVTFYPFVLKVFKLKNLFFRSILLLFLMSLLFMSNVGVAINYIIPSGESRNFYPWRLFYLSNENYQAMQWLEKKSTIKDVIISDQIMANHLPAQIGRRVYLGHSPMTIFFRQKINNLDYFFSQADEATSREFLAREKITYIYFSEFSQINWPNWEEKKHDYLEVVYQDGPVKIYQVNLAK